MNQAEQDRREERRRKRRKNQITAYIIVIVMIAVITVGIAVGVGFLTQSSKNTMEDKQSQLDAMFETEETLQNPETMEQTVELTDEQKLDEIVNAGIEVMPIEDKVAGLFIVTPESITGVSTAVQAGDGTRDALAKYAVGGIVYSGKNIQNADQIKQMIDNTQLYAKYPLFIGVDEEGGNISPVADAGIGTKADDAQSIGQTLDANNAYQAGGTIGTYLSSLGFNLDFAPVADVNAQGSILGSQSYGTEATTIMPFVTSMMQGLEEQKVTACLRQFPGLGSTSTNPSDGIATSDRSLDDFRANEFTVFQNAIDAGANMVMVSNLSATALTGDNTPCSLSQTVVTDYLRNELNFKGVIITDALNMAAIKDYYGSDEAAIMALKAGCDMILMPEDFETAYNGVLQAVQDGTISEERVNDSLRRIYRIKYADKIQ